MTTLRSLPRWLLLGLALLAAPAVRASEQAQWKVRLEPKDVRAGEAATVVVEATIKEPWHIYSQEKHPDGVAAPLPTSLSLLPSKALTAAGNPIEPEPQRHEDAGFKITVGYFEKAVAFGVPVKVPAGTKGKQTATVKVRYMACQDGTCTRPLTEEYPFTFTVAPGAARADRLKPPTTPPTQPAGYIPPAPPLPGDGQSANPGGGASVGAVGSTQQQIDAAKSKGLLAFMLFAFTSGLLALLTPCVFPMIPITVSYFSKQQEEGGGSGLKSATAYSVGIISTFTVVGVLVSAIFGPQALNRFATHPVVNIALGILFVVMAINLFGGFEIILPSWLVEKTQAGSKKGGLAGPFLMGLTFTLTSFTCTVAFVGTLLATAAASKDYLYPTLGMLAFGTAFASPFFALALFPQYLAKMPKAGGWLVTVKAYMGFLELMAALKFFSNADLFWQWGLLTRPVYLAIWFAIAAVAGLFMIGLLKLPHDHGAKIGPARAMIGAATLAASVWLLGGINRAPMGNLTAFLPPSQYGQPAGIGGEGEIRWVEDFNAAKEQARKEGKLLFVDFTGDQCSNCRVMEDTVFPLKEVQEELRKMVTVRLYTDRDTPQSREYASILEKQFGQTTLPLYVVLTPDGEKVGESAFNQNVPQFVAFLKTSQTQQAQVARGN